MTARRRSQEHAESGLISRGSDHRPEIEDPTAASPALRARLRGTRASPRTVHRPVRRPPTAVRRPSAPRRPQLEAAPAPRALATTAAAGGWALPLIVVSMGSFMAVLDTTIVNVAISHIQDQFGGSTTDVEWISTAYTLVLGIVVPTSAWLTERFGLRRVYLLAVIGFTLGSALCGMASSLDMLIAFRVLQAIGGGLLPVLAQTIVFRMVPRERIGMAMSLYGLGLVVAPAIGPTLGGWLVEDVDWRLIFYINVPVGVLVASGILSILPNFPRGRPGRFDVPGFLLAAAGLASLLIAFSEGSTWHWSSYSVLLLIAGGLVCLAIFVVVELSVAQPLLDLRLLGHWVFSISAVLQSLLQMGLFTGAFYTPLFLQQGQQLGALAAGLTMLPAALVTTAIMPLSGRIYDRIGARWPGAVGALLVAVGTYSMHVVTPQMGRELIVVANCIRNAGVGLALMPVMTGSMAGLPTARTNQASALNNLVGRLSSALALPMLTALLTQQEAQQYLDMSPLLPAVSPGSPHLQAIANGGQGGVVGLSALAQNQVFGVGLGDLFLLTAGLSAVGALLALFLPSGSARRRAAAAAPAPASGDVASASMHHVAV